MISLYDKYGGFDTFSMVVGNFYQKILDSEELAPYFETVNMERLMSHQTQFIATALGGPDKYARVDLRAVHAPYKITVPHFHEVVELLEESLDEASVEQEDISSIITLISGLMDQIATSE
ncbi:group I truncated hemoglobin [Colwellia psychrerythraea]|uniref:Globin n=1 Tax=Colwellia psychrerythraea TaxID=28229 RepID=A0A099KPC9_COLPS|nr:group 1 truncated hemoglobin [Colwellia psychrerythraea]KGJ91777.1 globin [Colwellia psychrerythraea]